jgi:hypothetical protein
VTQTINDGVEDNCKDDAGVNQQQSMPGDKGGPEKNQKKEAEDGGVSGGTRHLPALNLSSFMR